MASKVAVSKTPPFTQLLPIIGGLALLCVLALSACSTTKGKGETEEPKDRTVSFEDQRARYGNVVTEGLVVETADLREDGTPDQWTYRSPTGEIVRIERDLNFNGQVDMWQYLDPDGNLIEEEMDLDLDGEIDVVVFYKDGVMARKLLAVGFDGLFSIEKFYDSEGALLRIERDEDGDGVTNVWEYYENGRRVRVGWDTTMDGSPDTFDQF
ncbi:MAG: hypothetical protein ACNA8W_12920 [Bradymonadaceae bacterium]